MTVRFPLFIRLAAWAAVCLTALIPAIPTRAETFSETPEQQQDRLSWWRNARFGMFIHWGLYAIPGRGEWVQWNEQIPVEEYAKLADQFNPTQFDPDAWRKLPRPPA